MPELIGEEVPQVLEVISSSFMFRKLGICYDLKALPDEFPRKSLPTAHRITSYNVCYTKLLRGAGGVMHTPQIQGYSQ